MYSWVIGLYCAPTLILIFLMLYEAVKTPLRHKDRKLRVVVVNDCAYVWEDMKPFLTDEVEWTFIKRTRGWWSKTFGIAWKILRSSGDYYIVNYALQDAWLTQKLKHLDLLICHGGDIRKTIHSKKWGWMVRSNLRAATSVAYTSEDTADAATTLRPDAFLLHRPVHTGRYKPISDKHHLRLKAVYFKKHYDTLPPILTEKLIEYDCSLTILDGGVPHSQMPEFLDQYDVFIDQTTNRDYSKTCLEAMSCGLAVITWKDLHRLEDRVWELLSPERREMEGYVNRQFIVDKYDAFNVAVEVCKLLPK